MISVYLARWSSFGFVTQSGILSASLCRARYLLPQVLKRGRNDVERGRNRCNLPAFSLWQSDSGIKAAHPEALGVWEIAEGVHSRDLRNLNITCVRRGGFPLSGSTLYCSVWKCTSLPSFVTYLRDASQVQETVKWFMCIYFCSRVSFCSTASVPRSSARGVFASPASHTAASPRRRPTSPGVRENITGKNKAQNISLPTQTRATWQLQMSPALHGSGNGSDENCTSDDRLRRPFL